MNIYLVLAYDWDGVQRIWAFTKETDAWKFAEAQTDQKYSYCVEPITPDSKDYV